MMKDDMLYLIHIRECLDKIERYVGTDKSVFYTDLKTQDAVLRNLQIMAESTQRLSEELKQTQPEIEWVKIAGFRNVLVHQYLGVNPKQVVLIMDEDLPNLKRAVEQMIDEQGGLKP
jgi:uncharacterized protein with HEPN domain